MVGRGRWDHQPRYWYADSGEPTKGGVIMLKMTEQSRAFLEKYMPKYKKADSVNAVLDDLDVLMNMEGLDENDDPNEFWYEAGTVYDDLFSQN